MARLSEILKTNTSIKWNTYTENATVKAGDGVIADGDITITLPVSPAIGDVVQIILLNGSQIVVNRNTKLINGLSQNLSITQGSTIHTLVYISVGYGWFYSTGATGEIPQLAYDIAGNPQPMSYYGTNIEGEKGFYSLPSIDREKIPLTSLKDICAMVTAALTL